MLLIMSWACKAKQVGRAFGLQVLLLKVVSLETPPRERVNGYGTSTVQQSPVNHALPTTVMFVA